jgi:catechol 2,3-dioxygenase-like lactoylglutathione lyase family enzyme
MKIKKMSPQLLVADLERSLDFYTTHLGFEIDFRYEDFYAGISNKGHSIHFKLGKPVQSDEAEHLDLYFSVEAIEKLFEDFKSGPVTIVQTLREMPYGREFYITDPDGYILGFITEK